MGNVVKTLFWVILGLLMLCAVAALVTMAFSPEATINFVDDDLVEHFTTTNWAWSPLGFIILTLVYACIAFVVLMALGMVAMVLTGVALLLASPILALVGLVWIWRRGHDDKVTALPA